jgi:glycosidase
MLLKNIIILLMIFVSSLISQSLSIDKVEPPNWWVGMKWNRVQLMIYGSGLSNVKAQFEPKDLKIEKIHQIENSSYAFIDVIIPADIKPATFKLTISTNQSDASIDFTILSRTRSDNIHQGFSSDDIIYLITPDRFVNGDPGNDFKEGMRDSRKSHDILGRHGGDIQGIIDKLEYLSDLGVTALWINPLVENDVDISYHGYGATDFYKLDPRFGTNELYKELVVEAHSLGIKIIMDHVSNHIGIYHAWINNLPTKDWLNGTLDNHENNFHAKKELNDIHGDSLLRENVQKGWFVDEMPDLNQKNPFLAHYIIQNTLWWIEYAGIDGIREDTYPYADALFLSNWAEAIINEYPNFNIVGEVWIHVPAFLATYQTGSYFPKEYDSHLPSVTDFGLFEAFGRVFNRDQSIGEIHSFLSKDFLYPDPYNLVIFLDNHDVMRTIDLVDGDIQRYKLALQILLTTRGIPQIYYGTEIGLKGGIDHGEIRRKFPGGFPGDKRTAFKSEGRTAEENEIWQFLKYLIKIRKTYDALSKGKLIHFPVFDEFYMYFRTYEDEIIMIIVNNKVDNRELELKRLERYFSSDDILENLKTGESILFSLDKKLAIAGYDMGLYKIIKSK